MAENQNAPEKAWRAFFIDSENGIGALLYGVDQLRASDLIVMFHRDNVSKNVREQLESCPAQVDWVRCGSPKLKNSMDFQIVTELTARLASDDFDEAFVVSRDKGFQAAVKHLEEQPIAKGHELACVRDILQGIFLSKHRVLMSLREVETRDDIQHCFELVFSKQLAQKIVTKMTEVIEREVVEETATASAHELDAVVYEVPNETAMISRPASQRKTIARKALHGFIRLIYGIRNAGAQRKARISY